MRTWIFSLFFLLLYSCQSEPQEKVIKVYSNGNPEIVHLIDPDTGDKVAHRAFYDDGQLRIEGMYLNDQKHGKWIAYYSNGNTWTINNYEKGEYHGEYLMYNPDGSLRISGHYTLGKESGHWEFYGDDGSLAREIDY